MGERQRTDSADEDLQRRLLVREEGIRLEPYRDTEGFWTVGVGHLIDRRRGGRLPAYVPPSFPITPAEALEILGGDIADKRAGLDLSLPWWRDQNITRRAVLVSMAFQLGVPGLLRFTETLIAVEAGDYAKAARQMLASKWAQQTPARARRHAEAMESGAVEALGNLA